MIIPGYKTAKEAVPIIGRATATITKWCSQDMVPGAKKVKMEKFSIWVIPDATVEMLKEKTPSRAEAKRRAGKKTADKIKAQQGRVKVATVSRSVYPPATPKQIAHDATLAWIENLRRIA